MLLIVYNAIYIVILSYYLYTYQKVSRGNSSYDLFKIKRESV